MEIIVERSKSGGESPHPTSSPGSRDGEEMTPRMHFYAVRSAGDQLRWRKGPGTSKKLERMAGR